MNFLQICKYNLKSFGGIEYVTKIIHNELKHCHKIFSVSFLRSKDQKILSDEIACNINLTFFNQPISLKYIKFVYNSIRKAECIIYHHPNPVSLILLVLRIKRIKNLIVFWHSDIINFGILGKIIYFFEKFLIKKSNIVIFTSKEYYKNSYISDCLVQKQVKIIPIGLDTPKEKVSITFQKKDYLNIVFIGRFIEYKGILQMLGSLSKVNVSIRLTIIGSGYLRKKIDEKISNLASNIKVKVLENISDDSKYRLLSKANFLILPSRSKAEAFGIVLIESMSVGTPIITHYVKGSGMNEVNSQTDGAKVGYVYGKQLETDLPSLINKIYTLSINEYKSLKKNAHLKYLKKYTLAQFKENLRKIILDAN